MNLSKLYQNAVRIDTDLACAEIEQYCLEADEVQTDKQFNFGFMSLKWALYQIAPIDPNRLKHVFKAILLEHVARNKSIDDIQFQIMKYAAVNEYRAKIQENTRNRVDLADLPHFSVGDFNIIINTTGHNLTARIMRDTNADAILFIEPDLQKAGIQFRVNSKMNKLTGFKQYFFDCVSEIETGWTFVGETCNLIINHGTPNRTPSTIDIEKLETIICNYFKE